MNLPEWLQENKGSIQKYGQQLKHADIVKGLFKLLVGAENVYPVYIDIVRATSFLDMGVRRQDNLLIEFYSII